MANLEEQIKLLVELQGIDSQVLKLGRDLEVIPAEKKRIEEEYCQKMTTLKALEDGVKALQLKRKEKEGELQAKEESIKKYQSQLYQVKTNKEYSALEQEIARVRSDNSLIEEDIIRFFDQIDAENQKIAREKDGLKGEEAKMRDAQKKLDDEAKIVEGEIERVKAGRAALAAKVDPVILRKYEKILQSKDGLAVVPLASESCQGCFRVLPPQVINEVRLHKEIVICDNCSRILYCEE